MNCRKIGLSGCQALGLVFHMKMTPYFGDVKADLFVSLLQSKDCTRAFVLHAFSCLICLRLFQEVSGWGRCLEICVVQGLVCQIFFSDGGCHEKQQ